MAIVTKHALAETLTPVLDVGVSPITQRRSLASADAANGDVIKLLTFPKAGRIHKSDLSVSATLGAGCTLKLAVGDGVTNVDLTGATTAAAASKVNGAAIGPIDFVAGSSLFAIVGGANVAAAANIVVDALVVYN